MCVSSVGKTLRHEVLHLLAALVLSLAAWYVSADRVTVIATFAACFFLDADHAIDYIAYIIKFRQPFSVGKFLSGSYFVQWQKFITPLHSWELVVVLIITGALTHNQLPLWLAGALATHYVLDYLTNPVNGWAYWLIYRGAHRWYKPAIARGFIG